MLLRISSKAMANVQYLPRMARLKNGSYTRCNRRLMGLVRSLGMRPRMK